MLDDGYESANSDDYCESVEDDEQVQDGEDHNRSDSLDPEPVQMTKPKLADV